MYSKDQCNTASKLLAEEVDLLRQFVDADAVTSRKLSKQVKEIWRKQDANGVSLDYLVCKLEGRI